MILHGQLCGNVGIIGPARLNYRVRDGNGCDPRGMITRKLETREWIPLLIPSKGSRVRQQKLCTAVKRPTIGWHTSSTSGRTTLCRKSVLRYGPCEPLLLFLKDGLRKFYD